MNDIINFFLNSYVLLAGITTLVSIFCTLGTLFFKSKMFWQKDLAMFSEETDHCDKDDSDKVRIVQAYINSLSDKELEEFLRLLEIKAKELEDIEDTI